MIKIDIRKLDGTTIPIDADIYDKILLIKIKLNQAGEPDYEHQRLIYSGKELQNNKTLEEYGILDDNKTYTIHLIIKKDESTTYDIYIKKQDDTTLHIQYDLKIDQSEINWLKSKIRRLYNIREKFDLFIEDIKLENDVPVKYYLAKSNTFNLVMK
jgi:hypothetical protein